MTEVESFEELRRAVAKSEAVLVYVSTEACSIGAAARPKVEALLARRFPKMLSRYVDANRTPELTGQWSVFDVPTVLVFFAGRETARFSRAFGISELEQAIERPYELLFG